MSLPVVNISSDSENSDDSVIIDMSQTNSSQSQKLNSENVQSCSNDSNITRKDPLFKIIFRDEITSRKYRKRIEDIIKYVMSTEINENSNDATESNLLLEIYDSVESNCSSKTVCSSQEEKLCNNINNNNNKRKKEHSPDPHKNEKRCKFASEPENEVEFLRNNKETQCNQEPVDLSKSASNERVEHVQNNNENNERQLCTPINESEHEENYSPTRDKLQASFENCFVKIGSYEYFSTNRAIHLTRFSLTLLYVPRLKNDYKEWKVININFKNVSKVLVDFEKPKPKLYFMVSTKTAKGIRNLLNMRDQNGPYLDPKSLDQNHQYIVISPEEEISDKTKDAIKKSFKNKIFNTDELTVNKTVALESKANATDKEVTTSSNELQTSSELPSSNLPIEDEIFCQTDTYNRSEIFYCKIIRIGSYEYVKKRVFSISEHEVKLCAPVLNPSKTIVVIKIDMNKITEIRIDFSNFLPVMFLYITMEAARDIRNILEMTDPAGLYFDPEGDDVHNKIIIFTQKISENSNVIKKLVSTGKVKKLDEENAGNILKTSLSSAPSQPTENLQSVLNVQPTGNIDVNCVDAEIELNFDCLKIGTFKCKEDYIKFSISNRFFKFIVTPNLMCRSGTFYVNFSEVTKILYYLSKKWKVLCFYTTASCAEKISSLLRLYDKNNSSYLDPHSHDPFRQSICIILNLTTKHGLRVTTELLKNVLAEVPNRKMSLSELEFDDDIYKGKLKIFFK